MTLRLATAELGNRIRRAFGVRGAIETSVDELCSLTAHAVNLDAPPWRTEGLGWMGWLTQAAVAGQNSFIQVGNGNDSDLMIVERILINNQTAGAASFHVGCFVAAAPAGGLQTTELAPVGAAAVADAPGGIGAGSAVLAPSGFIRVTIPVGGHADLTGLQLRLQPGIVIRVFTAAVNLDITATFQGRWWPRQV